MTVTPLKKYILVEPVVEEVKPGEFVIPNPTYQTLKKYKVVTRGEEVSGNIYEGVVLLATGFGHPVPQNGKKYELIEEGDVIAIIK